VQLRRETKYVAKLEKVLVEKDLLPFSLKELLLPFCLPICVLFFSSNQLLFTVNSMEKKIVL
jgi:hypothetical protein